MSFNFADTLISLRDLDYFFFLSYLGLEMLLELPLVFLNLKYTHKEES